MESSASRVAQLMLRRNSRKDLGNLGTLFSQWSARTPNDPTRRMAMGGAPPTPAPAPEPTLDACMDAFCAVQLTPTNSIGAKDALPSLLSPRGSLKNLASLLLSPAASLKDGTSLLSPQASVGKAGLDTILRSAFAAAADPEDAPPLECRGSVPTTPVGGRLQVC
ncbi:hypothetical protein PLESTB_000480800 [Pleodorina starrii]|uniref:Uncharacterized protein n=1 Tax=Pleodorina starrii TaxID=330485 RepID=A0A9W6BGA1_9CHLO|nr:hypothetical protein PLESTM_001585700 [Pleodorina starrii]GLC51235.1 hypothetical protein PLESTB_000480800 [Pleodorina starrii]GLC63594.1 hypothetical protein PLESTF_000053200 [Pleodorina starrii]